MRTHEQLRTIPERVYSVTYMHKSDVLTYSEFGAKQYTDKMDTETLRYFLLSPDIIISYITPEFATFFR